MVLTGAIALWGASQADHKRLAGDLARLTQDNHRLAETVEQLSDVAWELHESDERYRSLTEARQRAEAANQAKSRVLATVSHEFRTPLNGILGLAGLLMETPLTPDQETYARAVHSSGEALLALVDDMLDFSRIEAGRLELRPAPTDVELLLQEIAELLAARAHAKGIDIATDVDPALPAIVMVDPARLRQVLINLAGNGVKFTETGGVTLGASLRGRPDESRIALTFSVADTGPGIAPEEAERLFGEFEQIGFGAHPPPWRRRAGARHLPAHRAPYGGRADRRAGRWGRVRVQLRARTRRCPRCKAIATGQSGARRPRGSDRGAVRC